MENSEPDSQGLHQDLVPLLLDRIEVQPEDIGLRLQLLELYYSDRNKAGFLNEARALNKACKRSQDPEGWGAVVSMGKRLLPEEQLFLTMGEGIDFDFDVSTPPSKELYQRIGEKPEHAPYFEVLNERYMKLQDHAGFMKALEAELSEVINRPTPMMHARRLSEHLGGAQIYVKREDLSARYTQLTISVLGQAMMAKRLGYSRLVTTSVNGFRAVMTASIARRLDMQVQVFVDARANAEQPGNLKRLHLLGAEVETVNMGTGRQAHDVHDAAVDWDGDDIREIALDYCAQSPNEHFMVTGLDALPGPYPSLQTEFQAVIGRECMRQVFAKMKRLPDLIVARAGDNPDAIGAFAPFLKRKESRLACVPILEELKEHEESPEQARVFSMESPHHVKRTEGRIRAMARALEGLEYPSVIREHQWLKATGRVEYPEVSRATVIKAIREFSELEGLIPAMATAHVMAFACEQAEKMSPDEAVVIVTSERTELGIDPVAELVGVRV